MTLGRIFDSASLHNIHILIKICSENVDIFNKESFSRRWKENRDKAQINNWLPEYLKGVYEPSKEDFRVLKVFVAKRKKEYEKIYSPIRHQFGHNNFISNESTEKIFNNIQIKTLEKFCIELYGIHEALWQLYHNGKGSMLPLRIEESSTDAILKDIENFDYPGHGNIQFIREAKNALDLVEIGFEKIKNS